MHSLLLRKSFLIFTGLYVFLSFLSGRDVKVIAHRGYWNTDGSAQNSITALEKANRTGIYGIEFDVHMTLDGVLVVYHDDKIDEMEIQLVPYTVIKDKILANGEKIPTLREYLEAAKHTDKKLIFELKPHKTPQRNREAARASVELINEKKLVHRTEYITFNLDAGKELILSSPESDVYYLNGELSPQALKDMGFAGLDYHFSILRKYPEWCKDALELGLNVNVWTVNDTTLIREMIELGVNFVTTDIPVEALDYISTLKKE